MGFTRLIMWTIWLISDPRSTACFSIVAKRGSKETHLRSPPRELCFDQWNCQFHSSILEVMSKQSYNLWIPSRRQISTNALSLARWCQKIWAQLGATASSYDSIFVCNPKLLLLTLALLAKKNSYSWIKFHREITSNRVSSDPHVDCHVPNQVHIPVNFAVYFSYTSKWQDIT